MTPPEPASSARLRPVVWSIAGNDSGGGAGLSADMRTFDAFAVHGCPIVAVLTAQNSMAVQSASPVGVALLEPQLLALEHDMPPLAIKTGALGSVAQVELVARWVDRLRERGPVALVVDPVLRATTGGTLSSEPLVSAYVRWLVPRATLVTPNRGEALALATAPSPGGPGTWTTPELAALLRTQGATSVCVTGGDERDTPGMSCDWLDSDRATGWLESPRIDTSNHHGTGCTFASGAAAALALGHVPADAVILAKMNTSSALQAGHGAGRGAGPVMAREGYARDAQRLPRLAVGGPRQPGPRPWRGGASSASGAHRAMQGLYGITGDPEHLVALVESGVRVVQWRHKSKGGDILVQARRLARICRDNGAQLFINDHAQVALDLLASGHEVGLHLGQEDVLGLESSTLAALRASGIALGVSSHTLSELCRTRDLETAYVACGPVWPTTTKDMPWKPQGVHNLRWWRAMTAGPLAAIGGIVGEAEVEQAAAAGADLVCLVRGLAVDRASLPGRLAALEAARLRGRAQWLADARTTRPGADENAVDLPTPPL